MRAAEERFAATLRGAPLLVTNQDAELRYTWAPMGIPGREAAPPEDLLGRTDEELVPADVSVQLSAGKRAAEAEHLARMGSWEWDIARNHVTWPDGLFEVYGIDPAEWEPRYARSSERVHPDDRERVDAAAARARGEVLLPERDVEPERLRLGAGERRMRSRLRPHARDEPLDRVAAT